MNSRSFEVTKMNTKLCNEHSDEIKPVEMEILTIDSAVSSKFSVSWSDEDKLAIVVEEGVFIFELWPTPQNDNQTITFVKYCISSSAFTSKNNTLDNYKFLWNMNKKNAFDLALDPTLSNIVEKPDSQCFSCHIIQCEFSPSISNESYVSCLTNLGTAQIFKKEYKNWVPVVNITKLWKSHCNINDNFQNTDFQELERKLKQLKITCIKWFSECEPIFVTCHKSGEICCWRIDMTQNFLSMKISTVINTNFQNSTLGLVHCERYNCTVVIVGTLLGPVKGFSFNSKTGYIHQEFPLWLIEDNINSDSIKIECSNDKFLVFIVKRHVLLVFKLVIFSKSDIKVVKMVSLPFSNAISGLSKCQDNYLLSLTNHSLHALKIDYDADLQYSLNVIYLGIKTKVKNSYHCYGLAISKNEAIWIILSSAKLNYDSLKEVTVLSVFTTEKKRYKELRDSTCTGIINQIVKYYPQIQMSEIYDFLELKRLELLADDMKFNVTYECDNSMSLLELKLLLWEAKLKQYCNSVEVDSAITDLETAIIKKHATKLIEKYETVECLSDVEKKSLKVSSNLLFGRQEQEESTLDEVCKICGEQIVFDSIRTLSCSNNHKFPRCCISLLPCDNFNYSVCQKCDSVALTTFVTEDTSHCLFCDGFLILNTKLLPSTEHSKDTI